MITVGSLRSKDPILHLPFCPPYEKGVFTIGNEGILVVLRDFGSTMEFLQPLYIGVIGLSFIVSLISFKENFPFYLKFFSVLLGLTFLVEVAAVYGVRYFHLRTNSHIYNSFMLVEFCAYAFFFKQIFNNKKAIAFSQFVLAILVVSWMWTTYAKYGLSHWNSIFSIVGSCCTILLAIIYYAQLLPDTTPVRPLKRPAFLIATGMLIFYAALLPYLGTLNYLSKYSMELAVKLLSVLRILNIIMYSLFIYAFICQRHLRKYQLQ